VGKPGVFETLGNPVYNEWESPACERVGKPVPGVFETLGNPVYNEWESPACERQQESGEGVR
jgi:hypothetical protein